MSVINKYPFINSLLDSLSSDQLKDLNDCINGQYEGETVFRTLKSWGSNVLTSSDKGIYPINLELNGPAAFTLPGYLVYTDDYCVLISYANDEACKLSIVNITMPEAGSDIKWEYVSESLTVNELRSCLFDAAAGSGGGGGGSGGGSGVDEFLLRKIRITVSLFDLDDDPDQVFYGDISLQDLFYANEDLYDDYEDDIDAGNFATLLEDMSDDLEDSADIRTDFANAINTLLGQNVVFKNITFDWSGTVRKGIIVDRDSLLCFIDNGDGTVCTQEMSAFSNFANTTFCTITVSDTYDISD